MENLEKYGKTELLKIGNDIKNQHDNLKKGILVDIDNIVKLELIINEKTSKLEILEKNYVKIVEKLTE